MGCYSIRDCGRADQRLDRFEYCFKGKSEVTLRRPDYLSLLYSSVANLRQTLGRVFCAFAHHIIAEDL